MSYALFINVNIDAQGLQGENMHVSILPYSRPRIHHQLLLRIFATNPPVHILLSTAVQYGGRGAFFDHCLRYVPRSQQVLSVRQSQRLFKKRQIRPNLGIIRASMVNGDRWAGVPIAVEIRQ